MEIKGSRDFNYNKSKYERPLPFVIVWIEAVKERQNEIGLEFYEEIRSDFFNEILDRTNQLN